MLTPPFTETDLTDLNHLFARMGARTCYCSLAVSTLIGSLVHPYVGISVASAMLADYGIRTYRGRGELRETPGIIGSVRELLQSKKKDAD